MIPEVLVQRHPGHDASRAAACSWRSSWLELKYFVGWVSGRVYISFWLSHKIMHGPRSVNHIYAIYRVVFKALSPPPVCKKKGKQRSGHMHRRSAKSDRVPSLPSLQANVRSCAPPQAPPRPGKPNIACNDLPTTNDYRGINPVQTKPNVGRYLRADQ